MSDPYWLIKNSLGHPVGDVEGHVANPVRVYVNRNRIDVPESSFSAVLVVNGREYPEPRTPEIDKLGEVREYSQKIGEFLDWLEGAKDYCLCYSDDESDKYCTVHTSREELLAEFFGIDLREVEREKREVLFYLRIKDGGDPRRERLELGL